MCGCILAISALVRNPYGSAKKKAIGAYWRPSSVLAVPWTSGIIGPRKLGAYVRRARNAEDLFLDQGRELVAS